jgi:hypothetical protein
MMLSWKENRHWAENRKLIVVQLWTYTMNENKPEATTSLGTLYSRPQQIQCK